MNTVRSTWYGWATLIVAGSGAYYFAKREINAERHARHEQMRKREALDKMAYSRTRLDSKTKKQKSDGGSNSAEDKNGFTPEDHAGSPSSEASNDPAPTRHIPETGEQMVREKSKYEATEPWRAKKGDRFS